MTALMHSGNFYWIKEYFLSMLLQGKISIFVRWQRGRLREDENPKANFRNRVQSSIRKFSKLEKPGAIWSRRWLRGLGCARLWRWAVGLLGRRVSNRSQRGFQDIGSPGRSELARSAGDRRPGLSGSVSMTI
ncbi:hypothetical protein E4F39_26855 [Burkholderia pseudomallei]|nr:hypothetical protein [Burkholderia pseudomallei]MPT67554.1 hypothetical protein [Burkholderia pseudomallei]MPT74444.1 hypothetical protein [Burkholderia pseudomallei]MPT85539.1 hypothetical protein [Burkholderia pseudomallei]MPT91498.1 hypothetical protein [Burkholderia pseudomallei]